MKEMKFYYKKNPVYQISLPKRLIMWILNYIDNPINGYEHKTNENGEMISEKEQLSETQFQLILIASDYYKRGYDENEIIHILAKYFKNEDYPASS